MKNKNCTLSPCGRGGNLGGYAAFSLPRRKPGVRGILSALLITALLILGIPAALAASKGVNIYEYPRELPTKKLMDKQGNAVTLQDFKGQFLIVNFWSRNCAPCLREMETLAEFQEKTKNTGIKLIIVSNEREWSSSKDYEKILSRYGGETLDSYTDPKGDLMSAFGIMSFPNTLLINAKNLEIGRISGSADWSSQKVIEAIYQIKAENNNREPVNPEIGIKKIKVEELK